MKFEEITIGQRAEVTHTITDKDIEKFVALTGDDNKLHIDKGFASKTSFRKPVAHGMLGASFISTVIGTKIPGDGALWFAQNLEFLLPVRVGDTLTVKAEVTKKIDRQGVVELRTDVYNQHKQKVIAGSAKVKVVEFEKELVQQDQVATSPKVALVVGSTGGIGSVTAQRLAADGFDIVLHYNSNKAAADALQQQVVAAGRKCVLVQADIRDREEVKDMFEKIDRHFGGLSVLVNASTVKVANIKFDNLDWEDLVKHLDINIKGSFWLMKSAVPLMERYQYGKIINITTQAIEYPFNDLLPYVTAKSALLGFSKSAALDLSAKGIRVNTVSPGITDTELNADLPEKVKLVTAARTPMRRLAQAEDVANAIAFLASEKSDFITGETIRVNGGQLMI
jgi:3-oxoacyl-[acyl-carrier protein] reductase